MLGQSIVFLGISARETELVDMDDYLDDVCGYRADSFVNADKAFGFDARDVGFPAYNAAAH